LYVHGDRKTRNVCNCHDDGALTAFGIAHKRAPFFCGCETAIDKVFANIDSTPLAKILGKCRENLSTNALLGPVLEPAMAGRIWRIPWWQIFRRRACAQDPVDALQNFPWFTPRAARGQHLCFLRIEFSSLAVSIVHLLGPFLAYVILNNKET
jgi:hypothetical protein